MLASHAPLPSSQSSNIFIIGATVRWHLGHTNYMFEDSDDAYSLSSVCGPPCSTLESVGKAFLGFGGLSIALLALGAAAIACSVLGCGIFDGNRKLVMGLLNLSVFFSFLAMLLFLCGVAATVAPDGEDYNFQVVGSISLLNPNIFLPNYGAICHYLSLVACLVAVCMLKAEETGGRRGGGGRGGGNNGSRMYGGSAMRPAVGGSRSKTKTHGRRPSGMKAGGKGRGGYV